MTVLRYLSDLLQRVFKHEICRIESSSDDFSSLPEPEGYETRAIDSDEFRRSMSPELIGSEFPDAFTRGDMCIASLKDGEVVGYTFFTNQLTSVNDEIVFRFPETFLYNYGSMTAQSHRGKKLEGGRWKVGQIEQISRTGSDTPRIFYVNVMNLESRAAGRGYTNNRLLGYSAYGRIAGRWFCFRSPDCRQIGAGFWRASV
jgi:hypothetical protein